LSIRFDACEREELELEGFAVGGRIEVDIVLFALVLYDN